MHQTPESHHLVPHGAEPERLATEMTWTEGPLWVPESRHVRWSDIPGNRIMAIDPNGGELYEHRTGVEFTNGRALDEEGVVVQCSHGRRALERERADGSIEVLVDRFGDARLNSPNDVAVHADGSLWFTDPPYGITQPEEGYPGDAEYGGCFVFRWTPHDGLTPIVTTLARPNGVAFSPDFSTLYVTNTEDEDGPDRAHGISAWSLSGEGAGVSASDERLIAAVPGVPDGIAVDAAGNVWSSAGDGVHVFTPSGQEVLFVPVPEVVSNVTFGGPDGTDLFITATSSLYRLRTSTTAA